MKVINNTTGKMQRVPKSVLNIVELTEEAFIEDDVLFWDGVNGINLTVTHWEGHNPKGNDSEFFEFMAFHGRVCKSCLKAYNKVNTPLYVEF